MVSPKKVKKTFVERMSQRRVGTGRLRGSARSRGGTLLVGSPPVQPARRQPSPRQANSKGREARARSMPFKRMAREINSVTFTVFTPGFHCLSTQRGARVCPIGLAWLPASKGPGLMGFKQPRSCRAVAQGLAWLANCQGVHLDSAIARRWLHNSQSAAPGRAGVKA